MDKQLFPPTPTEEEMEQWVELLKTDREELHRRLVALGYPDMKWDIQKQEWVPLTASA